jgi:hypothetical protein
VGNVQVVFGFMGAPDGVGTQTITRFGQLVASMGCVHWPPATTAPHLEMQGAQGPQWATGARICCCRQEKGQVVWSTPGVMQRGTGILFPLKNSDYEKHCRGSSVSTTCRIALQLCVRGCVRVCQSLPSVVFNIRYSE